MTLVRISDLDNTEPGELSSYIHWASEIKEMWERFVEQDDEGTSYIAGYGSARTRTPGIHASEISGGCLRKVVYSLLGVDRVEKSRAKWKKRFRVGHAIHALLQDDFHRMAEKSGGLLHFESEVSISPKIQEISKIYDIHSSCDGILSFRDVPDGPFIMRVGLEIKTESDLQFQDLKRPYDYHIEQAMLYMKALDLPLLAFFYMNKSNQNVAPTAPPFLVKFDHKIWGEIERKIQRARASADEIQAFNEKVIGSETKLPDRKEGMQCEFCAFSWTCEPEYLKKKQQAEEFNKKRKALNRGPRRMRVPRSSI